VPTSEDAPNSPIMGAYGGILLRPRNYFDIDPTVDMLECFILKRTEGADALPGAVLYGDAANHAYMIQNEGIPAWEDATGQCMPEFPEIVYDGTYAPNSSFA